MEDGTPVASAEATTSSAMAIADGCLAHDDLGALQGGLPSPAGGSKVSSGEAGLDRIELDLWQRLGVLDSEHRDGGLTRAVNDGGEVELASLRIGDGPERAEGARDVDHNWVLGLAQQRQCSLGD